MIMPVAESVIFSLCFALQHSSRVFIIPEDLVIFRVLFVDKVKDDWCFMWDLGTNPKI